MKHGVPPEGFRTRRVPSNIWYANCHDPPHFPLRFWIDPISVCRQLERSDASCGPGRIPDGKT
ncbi:hypothetical protein GBZ48_32930 [Azospirillum melinis]|uniref:Uncharacterized protein n=1 Tax=Azospirillum melinis TaxID=328839 RepID=A0ABX2KMV7_9PROT|nr:hypothetical protein [Azospirillum melinis]